VSSVATLSTQKAEQGLLACSSDINGSALDDTVVQKNCSNPDQHRRPRSGKLEVAAVSTASATVT
jgi:hypothetical protein